MACEVVSVIRMLCAAVPDLPIYLSQTLHFALREIMDCGARDGLAKGLVRLCPSRFSLSSMTVMAPITF